MFGILTTYISNCNSFSTTSIYVINNKSTCKEQLRKIQCTCNFKYPTLLQEQFIHLNNCYCLSRTSFHRKSTKERTRTYNSILCFTPTSVTDSLFLFVANYLFISFYFELYFENLGLFTKLQSERDSDVSFYLMFKI